MPEIVRLRAESDEPITAYIDSRGGSVFAAERLYALLKAPNPDGVACRLITVVTTHAASAAADLLSLGDYAIAYPQATILCHGARLSAEEITKETAEGLAASLQAANEEFALRLAKRVFARMAFLYTVLRPEFDNLRRQAEAEKWERRMDSDLECFAFAIFNRLSPWLRDLPRSVFFLNEYLREMQDFVFSRLRDMPEDQSDLDIEADVLKHLIDFELLRAKQENWSFTGGGFERFAADFRRLTDFLFGKHLQELEDQIKSFGILFLRPEQIQEFEQRRADNVISAENWMKSLVRPAIEPLWYFVVALCRMLQQGENRLTAEDAYWLGLVDEVIGARLISLRLIVENPDV
ncbi:MAG: ATP-dependent Clp protease proteolytic subunit [Verrucomicrobiae bacterium]|nr:ATP-dependent Clp protease proteolytic subunit [Verrucomicrobiae bacterium]